ncbi:MAG: XdhC family protein [Pseudomonadota bacterium]
MTNAEAQAAGLACGGMAQVLVEPVGRTIPVELLENLVAANAARQPIAYVTDLHKGAPRLAAADQFQARFQADQSGLEDDATTFVVVHNPQVQLVIVGGGEIARHLAPMAIACGSKPIVIDPRPGFATEARFQGADIIANAPEVALQEQQLDARTALIALSHDPTMDDPALVFALESPAFYIGALGSQASHAKRCERFKEAGYQDADLARLNAPVGLDIGAKHPAEIALSIMAEVTVRLRKGA